LASLTRLEATQPAEIRNVVVPKPKKPKPKAVVLVVDPSVKILDDLRKSLDTTTFELHHTTSGLEALKALKNLRSKIDVAIVALELHDVDSLDLIGLLLEQENKPVKIIATSSFFGTPLRERAKALGVHEVVLKPIDPQSWRTKIETVLRA
jgi:PleD family two-component response regulator